MKNDFPNMVDVELNLDGLTEEELRHIEQVLSRDKKLHENFNSARSGPNNDHAVASRQETTASELVLAEIERVHNMSANTSKRGSKSSVPPDTGDSSEEGFFQSFAGMLVKGIEAIDLNSSHDGKGPGKVRSLVRAIASPEQSKRFHRSLKYSPGQSIRHKPTLLELASAKRPSIAPIIDVAEVNDENDNPAYKVRNRGNAMFSSTSSTAMYTGTNSLPRPSNRRRSAVSNALTPDDIRYKSNSSLNLLPAPKGRGCNKNIARSATMGNEALLKLSPVRAQQKKGRNKSKNLERRRLVGSLPSLMIETPTKEKKKGNRSKDVTKRHSLLSQSHPEGNRIPETIVEVDRNNSAFAQSPDSGIYDRNGGSQRGHTDNESPPYRGDSSEENSVYNYEPDTESVYETDSKRDFPDDISLISDSSFAPSTSPMKRRTYMTQESWESDTSSGVNINPLSTSTPVKGKYLQNHWSPHKHDAHWMRSHDRRERRLQHAISTTSSKGFGGINLSSAGSSPAVSRKSLPSSGSTSPVVTPHETPGELSETMGNLEISLVYYTADSFRGKTTKTVIPNRGTKSNKEKRCDVLSRKEYVEVTDSNLELSKESVSGAPEKADGELHLTIHGANFKEDETGKNKTPNTYVKCYLLPDRFHNSKMKSAIIKKDNSPRWEHKFVLAGFSQSELRDRSLEIIVGNWHFKKQEVLGGAILSIGRGGRNQPWIKSTAEESYVWKSALLMSGNKIKTSLPLRAHMKPTYL